MNLQKHDNLVHLDHDTGIKYLESVSHNPSSLTASVDGTNMGPVQTCRIKLPSHVSDPTRRSKIPSQVTSLALSAPERRIFLRAWTHYYYYSAPYSRVREQHERSMPVFGRLLCLYSHSSSQ